ncbi:MAG: efflux RND transporter periplasmic adaptor subunit [Bryobacterales bacterium]|nr:efflux RND transporter periplasmic adaptor subunit [Bryobacterales bacterium]
MSHHWFFIAALPLALLNTGCTSRSASAAAGHEPVPVRVYRAGTVSFTEEQRYAGTTEPVAQVDLSFRAPGAVTSLYMVKGRPLEPGDAVPAGAVLAQLRATEYEARVHSAEAQLADALAARTSASAQVREAQAADAQARADLKRSEALYQARAATRAELDSTRARAESAQARLTAARMNVEGFDARIRAATAALEESRVSLGDTTLTAPFPGVVAARRVELGSSVAAGTIAYTLVDLRQMKVSFGVPDVALPRFPVGSAVQVNVDALPGAKYSGRVIGLAPAADPATGLFRVQALIQSPGGQLKAGMVASVVMDTREQRPMLAVPLRAIRRLGEGEGFAVLTAEAGTLQSRAVTLGPAQGALIGISSGLRPGEFVVEDAGVQLKAGDRVRVVP